MKSEEQKDKFCNYSTTESLKTREQNLTQGKNVFNQMVQPICSLHYDSLDIVQQIQNYQDLQNKQQITGQNLLSKSQLHYKKELDRQKYQAQQKTDWFSKSQLSYKVELDCRKHQDEQKIVCQNQSLNYKEEQNCRKYQDSQDNSQNRFKGKKKIAKTEHNYTVFKVKLFIRFLNKYKMKFYSQNDPRLLMLQRLASKFQQEFKKKRNYSSKHLQLLFKTFNHCDPQSNLKNRNIMHSILSTQGFRQIALSSHMRKKKSYLIACKVDLLRMQCSNLVMRSQVC